MPDTDWTEGRDGTVVRHAERLYPRWWVWLVALGFVGVVVIAYWAALGGTAAVITALVGATTVVALLLVGSPVVRVDDRVFRAGGARLPLRHVGRVQALDAETTREASTTGGDPAAHLMLRMLSSPETVIVEVTDGRDPHPYWLVTSRRAAELAEVLRAAAGGAGDSRANAAG